MGETSYRLERFLIQDVRPLLQEGLITGTLSAARELYGKSKRLFEVRRSILWEEAGNEAVPLLLMEFWPDWQEARRAQLYLRSSSRPLPPEALHYLEKALPALLLELGFWRITVGVAQRNGEQLQALEPLLQRLGFRLEGLIYDAAETASGTPAPVAQWTWFLRNPQNGMYFFLPFGSGLLVAEGDEEGTRKIGFSPYGQVPENPQLLLWASAAACISEVGELQRPELPPEQQRERLSGQLLTAFDQLRAYLNGELRQLDFPYHQPVGSSFQQAVWREISQIGYGGTRSYLDLARRLCPGDEERAHKLCRAVGAACAANPLEIRIPCHRVLGSDLSLTGFGPGVSFKGDLLNLELLGALPDLGPVHS